MHEYEEKHSHTNTLPNNFYNLSSDNYSSKYNLDWKKFEKNEQTTLLSGFLVKSKHWNVWEKKNLHICRDSDIALVYNYKDLFNEIKIYCYFSAVTSYVKQPYYNDCAYM